MDVAIGPKPLEERSLKRVPCVAIPATFPHASWYHILMESLGLLASLFLGASDLLRVTAKSGRGLHLCEIWTMPEREDHEPSIRASVSGYLARSLVPFQGTQNHQERCLGGQEGRTVCTTTHILVIPSWTVGHRACPRALTGLKQSLERPS